MMDSALRTGVNLSPPVHASRDDRTGLLVAAPGRQLAVLFGLGGAYEYTDQPSVVQASLTSAPNSSHNNSWSCDDRRLA